MKLRAKSNPEVLQPKPGQIGKYYLSKKPGRTGPDDPWCRTWYEDRRMHHISLRTSDLDLASRQLRDFVAQNERPEKGNPEDVTIDQVCVSYWEDHAKNLPSARAAKEHLALWKEFWKGVTVSELTPNKQREFRLWLGEGRLAPSTIDKILSTGRAALIRARKWQQLTSVPHIFSIETRERKRSRTPIGRPIFAAEMASFIDAIQHRNLLLFVMLCANTLARPAALYELRRRQYDDKHQRLRLNPEERIQTKKHRPIVPVTPSLRPWLDAETKPDAHFLTYRGEPVKSLSHVWKDTLKEAGLSLDITPYSFRHGMARELLRRLVPRHQIGLFLGHIPTGSEATTWIYTPDDPDYCVEAIKAIEAVMTEIRGHLKVGSIDDPLVSFGRRPMRSHRKLNDLETADLRNRLFNGESNIELSKQFGITRAAVRKHRIKLDAAKNHDACQPRAARNAPTKKKKQ